MKKLLVTTLVIFSSLICSAYAKEVNQEQDPVIQSQIEHQRIKLGIEELRKKYPISLLDEKKKHYKAGQKVNIDDYSEAEIKAAFLNADQNFVSRKKIKGRGFEIDGAGIWVDEEVLVKNHQELIIMDRACYKLRHSNWSKLNKKWRNLFDFIFSDALPISHYTIKYVPYEEAGHCLDMIEEIRGL